MKAEAAAKVTVRTEILRLVTIETTTNNILDIVNSLKSESSIKVETLKGKILIITTSITTLGVITGGLILGIVKLVQYFNAGA